MATPTAPPSALAPLIAPCPFCGLLARPYIVPEIEAASGMKVGWKAHIHCDCGATGGIFYTKDIEGREKLLTKVVGRWNSRFSPRAQELVSLFKASEPAINTLANYRESMERGSTTSAVPVATSDGPIARCFVDTTGNETQAIILPGSFVQEHMPAGADFIAILDPDARLRITVPPSNVANFRHLNMLRLVWKALDWMLAHRESKFLGSGFTAHTFKID